METWRQTKRGGQLRLPTGLRHQKRVSDLPSAVQQGSIGSREIEAGEVDCRTKALRPDRADARQCVVTHVNDHMTSFTSFPSLRSAQTIPFLSFFFRNRTITLVRSDRRTNGRTDNNGFKVSEDQLHTRLHRRYLDNDLIVGERGKPMWVLLGRLGSVLLPRE